MDLNFDTFFAFYDDIVTGVKFTDMLWIDSYVFYNEKNCAGVLICRDTTCSRYFSLV